MINDELMICLSN